MERPDENKVDDKKIKHFQYLVLPEESDIPEAPDACEESAWGAGGAEGVAEVEEEEEGGWWEWEDPFVCLTLTPFFWSSVLVLLTWFSLRKGARSLVFFFSYPFWVISPSESSKSSSAIFSTTSSAIQINGIRISYQQIFAHRRNAHQEAPHSMETWKGSGESETSVEKIQPLPCWYAAATL